MPPCRHWREEGIRSLSMQVKALGGLSDRDIRCYEMLVANGFSADCDDAVLDRLARLGLIEPGDGGWTARSPDNSWAPWLAEQHRAWYEARLWLALLAARQRPGTSGGDGPPPVEVLHSSTEGRTAYHDIIRHTRQEMVACDAPPYVDIPGTDTDTEFGVLHKGVRVRVLYDRQALTVPGRRQDILTGIARGEQARVSDVPMKMWLNDEPIGLVPLRLHPIDLESWLLVRDPALLSALMALFEMEWERAVPLTRTAEDEATGQGQPSAHERDLLALLTSGFTDQQIADHFDVHLRTAGRWVHKLMHRLDASTRFQAGYQAMKRGWISPDQR